MMSALSQRFLALFRRAQGWMSGVWWIGCGLVFFGPLTPRPGVDIDSSHMWVLAWAQQGGLQWGSDILFTYGPLGWLRGAIWLPGTSPVEVMLSYLYYGLFGDLLGRLLFPREQLRGPLMLAAVVVLPLWLIFAGAYDAGVFFVVLAGGYALLSGRQLPVAVTLAFLVFCAINVYVKYTFTVLIGFLLLLLLAGWNRTGRRLPLIGFVISLLQVALVSGTGPGEFFRYLFATWPLASGYAEAMALWGPPMEWIAFLVILISAGIAFLIASRSSGLRRGQFVLRWIWLAAVCFFVWKLAFVRHDGHAVTGMSFLIVLLLFFIGERGRAVGLWPRLAGAALGCWLLVALGAAWFVLRNHEGDQFYSARWERQTGSPGEIWTQRLGGALRPDHLRESFEKQRLRLRQNQPLPDGIQEPVDYYNAFAGSVLAHDLEYRPRPVFQSYSAYTPALIRKNRDYLLGPSAPQTLLTDLVAIDRRIPMMADGLSWLEILSRYQPVARSDRVLVWRQWGAEQRREVTLDLLQEGSAMLDESVALPATDGAGLWIELEIDKKPMGKLQNLLFKPSLLRLELETGAGARWQRRVIPGMSRTGFLLSPVIESPDPLLLFLADEAPGQVQSLQHTASSFRVRERAYLFDNYRQQFRYRLYQLQLGEAPDGEDFLADQTNRLRSELAGFAEVRALPSSFLVEVASKEEIGSHLLAHADARFSIAAPAVGTVMNVEFGLYDGSWQPGRTNGVGFRILGVLPDGEELLMQRELRPVENPAQRGPQTSQFKVDRSYERLIFATDPLGNTDWDWSYWRGLRPVGQENPLSP